MARELSHLSVVASAIGPDPRTAAPAARAAGFRGMLFDLRGGVDLTSLSTSGARELGRVLSANEQEAIGVRVSIAPKGLAPGADVDRALAEMEQAMKAAHALQARLVCVDLGPLPDVAPPPKPAATVAPQQAGLIIIPAPAAEPLPAPPISPPPVDPNFIAQVDGAMAALGNRADRYSITLALSSQLSTFAALERTLGAADCPWFGVDLDAAGIVRDDWPLDEILSRLGPLLRHIRARDAVRGSGGRTQPAAIGQGSIDWSQLLAAVDAAAYHGWITVDPMELPNRAAAAATAAAYLRRLR